MERDGIISRFKYTYGLCWRISKKILLNDGITVDTPKAVFIKLGEKGWIESSANWIDYMDKSLKTQSLYEDAIAEEIFGVIQQFIIDAEALVSVLKVKKT